MSLASRILLSIFTATPAIIWLILSTIMDRREYFWSTYVIVCAAFVVISFLLGFIAPSLLIKTPLYRPWTRILIPGGLAWLAAVSILGLLNLTPLCVGQNNGDGNNDLTQCLVQSVLVAIVYTPLELIMLAMSAITGGWIISKILGGETSSLSNENL